MHTYIAFLRAVNVGGHHKMKMNALRDAFLECGFSDVETYIQSGNVIFDSLFQKKDPIRQLLEEQIVTVFGYDIHAIIRTPGELLYLMQHNPFREETGVSARCYVTFFSSPPEEQLKRDLENKSSETEQYRFVSDDLFSLIDKETKPDSKFSNNFIENLTNIQATTRNLNTVRHMTKLASDRTNTNLIN